MLCAFLSGRKRCTKKENSYTVLGISSKVCAAYSTATRLSAMTSHCWQSDMSILVKGITSRRWEYQMYYKSEMINYPIYVNERSRPTEFYNSWV